MIGNGLFSNIFCKKRVSVSDIHVVGVANDVGDAYRIPIAVEDGPYLILDHEPRRGQQVRSEQAPGPFTTATNAELGIRSEG